jgi:hypothetical protein
VSSALPPSDLTGGMKLSVWRKQVGLSKSYCWKLRKQGVLKTVTRCGNIYITAAGIRDFFQADGSEARCPLVKLSNYEGPRI